MKNTYQILKVVTLLILVPTFSSLLAKTTTKLALVLLSTLLPISTIANEVDSFTVTLSDTDKMDPTYNISLAGSFNQWQMSDKTTHKMVPSESGYRGEFHVTESKTLFNIYRDGNWQNPIATEFGKPFTCGFLVDHNSTDSLTVDFHGWANEQPNPPLANTIVGNLITLKDFAMPQLERTGDVFVYLPASYQQEPKLYYPVVYMLDGQNLFSESTSFSYEWQVDETLSKENLEIIVVGISNGPQRWEEYNPWNTLDFTGAEIQGRGVDTINFIKQVLKPHVDKHYRTLTQAEHTGLAGSSLGGLMALYAAISHADTFGKVAAFSPSFSFRTIKGQTALSISDSNLIATVSSASHTENTKIYFDIGEVEYGSFELINALHNAFKQTGFSDTQLKLVKDPLGRHCELDWARRLPNALNWLMAD